MGIMYRKITRKGYRGSGRKYQHKRQEVEHLQENLKDKLDGIDNIIEHFRSPRQMTVSTSGNVTELTAAFVATISWVDEMI